MGSGIPQEANAKMRSMAKILRQMYIALINEGFKDSEALSMLATVLEAGIHANRKEE